MARFALICPPFHAHLRVFEALGEELVRRGHEAAFLLNAGAENLVRSAVLPVLTGPRDARSDRLLARAERDAAEPAGVLGVLRTVRDTAELTDALCRAGPEALAAFGAEAVIGDQLEPAAGLIAARLGLPHVSVACALPINASPGVPLPYVSWPYDPGPVGAVRDRGARWVEGLLMRRQNAVIAAWARRWALPPRASLAECLSAGLQISQTVAAFDLPRPAGWPVRYVGPMRPAAAAGGRGLPFVPEAGRPLVFATFGTLQGHRLAVFRRAAEACRGIGAQILIAHGGRLDAAEAASIGADGVADFVSYPEALARAAVCLTHGGSSTILAALEAGVPILAMPVAFDQPGNAARIAHHGVGAHLPLGSGPRRIAAALARLIGDEGYRNRAAALGRAVREAGGVELAADLVEGAMARG